LKITHAEHTPYCKLINQFVQSSFPSVAKATGEDLVDLITAELLASKKVRVGPIPVAETQVAIRDVIRDAIAKDKPIPILMPWGGMKPDASSIDVAELCGLKTAACLHGRILRHYPRGTEIRVRIEDATAPSLFHDRMEEAWVGAQKYTQDFCTLAAILESPVTMVPESALIDKDLYTKAVDEIVGDVNAYLFHGGELPDGINITAPPEAINWYLGQYHKLYPWQSAEVHRYTMARYLAGAIMRHKMGARGDAPEWGGKFIDVAFVQNPPGTDAHFNRRVIYRVTPGRTSIAPWRAKGFLKYDEDNQHFSPKLRSFRDPVDDLIPHVTTMSRGKLSVDVRTDYSF
jgi:hypothetical protein